MSGQKRIAKELAEITRSPPDGIRVSLISESDIHKWQILMDGPSQSPYAGGTFTLHLHLPTDYPFKPPTLSFQTKIYHPNVTNDDKGSMCLGMLRADEWKPSSKISAVLDFARQLLVEPMPDDAVEASIAQLYKEDRKEWSKRAKNWTKQYAMKA
ncbi:hypothetical protein MMC08_003989 [Hypocenomyce scalaris]|nr:hypothetical protein [Hypocenomyce scalaris]